MVAFRVTAIFVLASVVSACQDGDIKTSQGIDFCVKRGKGLTYDQADKYCKQQGMTLVEPNYDQASQALDDVCEGADCTWLGLKNNGGWKWVEEGSALTSGTNHFSGNGGDCAYHITANMWGPKFCTEAKPGAVCWSGNGGGNRGGNGVMSFTPVSNSCAPDWVIQQGSCTSYTKFIQSGQCDSWVNEAGGCQAYFRQEAGRGFMSVGGVPIFELSGNDRCCGASAARVSFMPQYVQPQPMVQYVQPQPMVQYQPQPMIQYQSQPMPQYQTQMRYTSAAPVTTNWGNTGYGLNTGYSGAVYNNWAPATTVATPATTVATPAAVATPVYTSAAPATTVATPAAVATPVYTSAAPVARNLGARTVLPYAAPITNWGNTGYGLNTGYSGAVYNNWAPATTAATPAAVATPMYGSVGAPFRG